MPRFYLLRLYSTGEFFSHWKDTGYSIDYEPVFVKPKAGEFVQAQIFHDDDVEAVEKILRDKNCRVDRVQVA